MRDGLARVAADYAVAADPVGEITAQYLAVLLDADAVAAVMTALRTEADAANHAELEAVLTEQPGELLQLRRRGAWSPSRSSGVSPPWWTRLAPYLQETQGNAVIIEKVASFGGRGAGLGRRICWRCACG